MSSSKEIGEGFFASQLQKFYMFLYRQSKKLSFIGFRVLSKMVEQAIGFRVFDGFVRVIRSKILDRADTSQETISKIWNSIARVARTRILSRMVRHLRSRILDKSWVQDSEQGFIYKEQSGPGFLTELRGLLGPGFWTMLSGASEGGYTGEKAGEQVQDFGQSCNGDWVQHFEQGWCGLRFLPVKEAREEG